MGVGWERMGKLEMGESGEIAMGENGWGKGPIWANHKGDRDLKLPFWVGGRMGQLEMGKSGEIAMGENGWGKG
ncbi:uncharacterized protein Gasu_65520, partial [Galdieria sulphuraria]